MKETLFLDLANLCEQLEKTKKRKVIADMIGDFLKRIAPDEIHPAVNLILGNVPPLDMNIQSIIEVISELIHPEIREYEESFLKAHDFGEAVRIMLERNRSVSTGKRLTVKLVYKTLEEIAVIKGPGSKKRKKQILLNLLGDSSPLEAKYIVKNVAGEIRHGVNEGMILEALSHTFCIDSDLLRKTNMLMGDIGKVAEIAILRGAEGLSQERIELFQPIKPMLARMANDIREIFKTMKIPFALEYKMDGIRTQIHKKANVCRIYSRGFKDITESLPEIVDEVLRILNIQETILDGEVIAVNEDGFPLPFQVLMKRLRIREIEKVMKEVPVRLYLFDILYRDGELLIDMPYRDRWHILESTGLPLVPRIIPKNEDEGKLFFSRALEDGHEGLVAKALSSPYTPGIRGGSWLKLKRADSLDLVIIAADWGYGRRHGWLSNYHLAARDERTGKFVPVGKTFKGLTDNEFMQMTERLIKLKINEIGNTVFVKPEVVVEVLFMDIQRSPHYESGYALRFARISRIRDDKKISEIDSIQTIAEIYKRQLRHLKDDF